MNNDNAHTIMNLDLIEETLTIACFKVGTIIEVQTSTLV